jgi:hypothetical protein
MAVSVPCCFFSLSESCYVSAKSQYPEQATTEENPSNTGNDYCYTGYPWRPSRYEAMRVQLWSAGTALESRSARVHHTTPRHLQQKVQACGSTEQKHPTSERRIMATRGWPCWRVRVEREPRARVVAAILGALDP